MYIVYSILKSKYFKAESDCHTQNKNGAPEVVSSYWLVYFKQEYNISMDALEEAKVIHYKESNNIN